MTLYSIEEQKQIKKQIRDAEERTLQNLPFYEYGYSAYSLEKLLPSDVPVIIVGKEINTEETDFLRKISNMACVIVADTEFAKLIEEEIKLDFLVAGADSEGKEFGNVEKCCIPMVTGIGINPEIMECHEGPKFLYWTGNDLEQIIWNCVQNVCSRLYRYNNLLVFPPNASACEVAMGISVFMGADQVYLIGNFSNVEIPDLDVDVINVREASGEGEREFLNSIVHLFRVETDMSEIIMKVLPFFDEAGREQFHEKYSLLMTDFEKVKNIIRDSLEKYGQLYQIAIEGVATNEKIRIITEALNQNTEKLEKCKYINYILKQLDRLEEFDYSVDIQRKNEIAEIAVEAIEKFEKMDLICEALQECLQDKNKDHGKKCVWKKSEKNKKSILLICGSSQYNVLPYFAYGLKEGFQKLGYNTYMLDFNKDKKDWVKGKAYSYYQNTIGLDYVLTINGVFNTVFFDSVISVERHVFDNPNTKVLSLFVDHPLISRGRLDAIRNFATVIYPEKTWVKFAKRYWPEIRNVLFLPLGGIEQETDCRFLQKENKMVFFGTYEDLYSLEENINNCEHKELIWKAISLLKEKPDYTVEEAFMQIEEECGLRYSVQNIMIEGNIWTYVNDYIRQYFRQKTLNSIIISGISIDIYGRGYQPLASYPNVKIHEPVPMNQMLEICRGVRFVLNVQPWLKDGTQERVFNAMLGGSICITDETKYLREQFHDGENILFYKLSELEKLPSKILYYMQNDQEAAQIAHNGYELAKENHTWAKRAEELSELLDKI